MLYDNLEIQRLIEGRRVEVQHFILRMLAPLNVGRTLPPSATPEAPIKAPLELAIGDIVPVGESMVPHAERALFDSLRSALDANPAVCVMASCWQQLTVAARQVLTTEASVTPIDSRTIIHFDLLHLAQSKNVDAAEASQLLQLRVADVCAGIARYSRASAARADARGGHCRRTRPRARQLCWCARRALAAAHSGVRCRLAPYQPRAPAGADASPRRSVAVHGREDESCGVKDEQCVHARLGRV